MRGVIATEQRMAGDECWAPAAGPKKGRPRCEARRWLSEGSANAGASGSGRSRAPCGTNVVPGSGPGARASSDAYQQPDGYRGTIPNPHKIIYGSPAWAPPPL